MLRARARDLRATFARFLSSDRKVLSKYGSVMAVSAILRLQRARAQFFRAHAGRRKLGDRLVNRLRAAEIASGTLADGNVFFFAFPSFTAQAREGLRAAMEHARRDWRRPP